MWDFLFLLPLYCFLRAVGDVFRPLFKKSSKDPYKSAPLYK